MAKTMKKATKFNRVFDPEFLQARKDITDVMLASARGDTKFKDFETVCRAIEENEFEIFEKNKDGNTLLLLAAANGHVAIAEFLLQAKADMTHKNGFQLDALDYATMDSVKTPIAKCCLKYCDFCVPEPLDGPLWAKSNKTLLQLPEDGFNVAKVSLLGKTPDLSDIFARETEYRHEWLKNLNYLANTVKRGILLLNEEVGYLERDAMLSGTLEVPISRRYVYCASAEPGKKVIRYSQALKTIYAYTVEHRMTKAATEGNAMAVASLLKADVSPNVEDPGGQTALMKAAHSGEPRVLKCLLQAKASVNTMNKDGYSAFILAAVGNHEQGVRMLLKAKADLTQKSYKGNTVMDFVKHKGNKNILHVINVEREKNKEAKDMARRQTV